MDYYQDLFIDQNILDDQAAKQPILNMQYHELLVDKNDELNEQKRQVKIKEAELKESYAKIYLFYKKQPDKKTEKETDSLVLVDAKYKKKQQEYFDLVKEMNDLQKEVDMLEGVVKSFQQRKNSLEKIIDLYIAGYNGSVKEKRQNEFEDKIHAKLNKRREK